MLVKTLKNALLKTGATLTTEDDYHYTAVSADGERKLEFYRNGGGDQVSVCVIRSPHTDVMTDCFCDTFLRKIKEARNYMNGDNIWC
jgi:hypothetical protein